MSLLPKKLKIIQQKNKTMGTCKYCGQSAGIFSKAHKECEAKHQGGVQAFEATVSGYFTQRLSAATVASTKRQLQIDAYLSEDDICEISDKEIRAYTASIHRPFSPSSMHLMDEFLSAIGVSYSKLHAKGGIEEFTKKLMRGFMIEYFTDQLDLQKAQSRCEKILAKFPMNQDSIDDAYLHVLDKAATNYMKNGSLSSTEQQKIDDYIHALALPVHNLPAKYQNSEIGKIEQMSIISKIQNGYIPDSGIAAPIILGRGEKIIWGYQNVNLYQEKVTREYVGRTGGFSFRIIKGVTYRTGGFKGHPVEKSSMEHQGIGTLFVTNKHLIFHSQTKSIKVPYTKLIGISPYSDGIEINRDGANVKRLTVQGFDPWFLLNILPYLAQSL